MPCYTISVISVELNVENLALLQKAAAALGLKIVSVSNGFVKIQTLDGAFSLYEGQATGQKAVIDKWVNPLRVQYSKTVVREAATRMGWQVSQQSDNKFTVIKA